MRPTQRPGDIPSGLFLAPTHRTYSRQTLTPPTPNDTKHIGAIRFISKTENTSDDAMDRSIRPSHPRPGSGARGFRRVRLQNPALARPQTTDPSQLKTPHAPIPRGRPPQRPRRHDHRRLCRVGIGRSSHRPIQSRRPRRPPRIAHQPLPRP